MHPSLKRRLVVGVAVLAVSAFAGGAFAATQEPAVSPRQAFMNDVAKRLNVSPAQLTSAVRGAFLDQLNTAVANKRLTQAQADAIKQRLQRGGALPLAGMLGFGFWALPGALFGPGTPPFKGRFHLGANARAGRLHLPLQIGGLRAAIVAQRKALLDRLVAAKQITSAQEAKLLARLDKRLSRLVSRRHPLAAILGMRMRSRFRHARWLGP
jgi:hypothetical protein